MIIIQGHARFAPGTAAAHLDAMRTMVEATLAEDGCELYAFAFDAIDPSLALSALLRRIERRASDGDPRIISEYQHLLKGWVRELSRISR